MAEDTTAAIPLTLQTAASKILDTFLSDEPEKKEPVKEKDPKAEVAAEGAEEAAEPVADEATPETAEETDEAAIEPPTMYKVTVDGQAVEVTEDELLKGYSRHEDYTRKTQKLAEDRKTAETERATELEKVRATRTTYAERLAQVEQALQALSPPEPNWEELRTQYPAEEVNAAYAQFHEQQKRIQHVAAERDRVHKESNAKLADEATQYLETERGKLRELVPEWKDPVKEAAGMVEMRAYGKEHGFSDEELNSVVDSRLMNILRKASLYDKGQVTKPIIANRIQKIIATATPGAPANRQSSTALTKAKQRLAQTGRPEDAQKAFEELL